MAEDDVVMMYKLIKDGCDVNYNETAMGLWIDVNVTYWEYQWETISLLHIASMEGSKGETRNQII